MNSKEIGNQYPLGTNSQAPGHTATYEVSVGSAGGGLSMTNGFVQHMSRSRKSPPTGGQQALSTAEPAAPSGGEAKKFRRISDKSQDHQRFFKNLIELPNPSAMPQNPQASDWLN